MSVSMLYIVTMTIKHRDNLSLVLKQFFNKWFISSKTNGACFSQLALCHALVAKTSPVDLATISVELDRGGIFFSLFPVLCSLLDW